MAPAALASLTLPSLSMVKRNVTVPASSGRVASAFRYGERLPRTSEPGYTARAMKTRLLQLLLASALTAACADSDPPAPAEDAVSDALADATSDAVADAPSDALPEVPTTGIAAVTFPNGWEARIDRATGVWFVDDASGKTILTGGGRGVDSILVGRGAPEVIMEFGGFQIDLQAESLAWSPLPAAGPTRVDIEQGTALHARWELPEGGTLVLSFSVFGPASDTERDVRVGLSMEGGNVTAAALVTESPSDQDFFGLGAQVFGMTLRGGKFPLWTTEQGIGKPDDYLFFPLSNIREASYAPMGIWHATGAGNLGAHTAIVGHDGYSELDLAETLPDAVVLRSYLELPSFVLVDGADHRVRMTHLGDYVGRPPEPEPWVFAPWNDSVGGGADLFEVATALRSNGIPSSAIWAEDWIGGNEGPSGYRLSYSWEWDPSQYPDLPTNITDLQADGFAFLAYFNTFVPNTTARFAGGETDGHLVKKATGSTYTVTDPAGRVAGLVDLTSQAATDWFEGYMRTCAETLGADGWMADFTEWMPHDAVLSDGQQGWAYHNRYPLDFQALNLKVLGENKGVFFARSGWASVNGGSAGLATTMWGGDQDTDWEDDDGYPSIVPLGVHLGLAGISYFGTDIAGYSSFVAPYTNKELFYRWTTAAALTPLMRTHHGSSKCGNWSFDRDAETLEHYKRWAIVHTLLYPTMQQLSAETQTSGWPMIRHPWFVAPDEPALWRDQDYTWFLGDDLYVAPVLAEEATARDVILPSGDWWPLFGEASVAGGDTFKASAEATELPVFVRAGTALVLLTEAVDSFYGASNGGITTLDDAAGKYRVALYPDGSGTITTSPVGGASVASSGVVGPVDYASATVDGAAVPACDAAGPTESCHGTGFVRVVNPSGSVSVALGSGTVIVDGDGSTTVEVSLAADAWGVLASPTAVTDLDPDIPPPCDI